MALIRFQCYVCNQELQVEAEKAGRKAKCVGCSTVLTIPMATGEEQEMESPSGPQADEGIVGRPVNQGAPRGDYDAPAPRGDDYDDRAPRRDRDDRRDDRDERRDDRDDRGRAERDDRYDDERGRRGRYDDDIEDRGARPTKWKSQWPKVNLGMLLAFIGMSVFGGAFLLEHVAALVLTIMTFTASFSFEAVGFVVIIGVITNVVATLGLGCFIAGEVFWIFITNKNNALTWAIVTLAVGGVAFLTALVIRMVGLFGGHLPYGIFQYGVGGRFGGSFGLGYGFMASMVLIFHATHFMMVGFYLRAMSRTFKDRVMQSRGMAMIITAGVAAGYQLIWPFIGWALIANAFVRGGPGVGAVLGVWLFYWGGAAAMITLFVMTWNSINMAKFLTDV